MVNLPTAGVDYHAPFGGRKGSSWARASRAATPPNSTPRSRPPIRWREAEGQQGRRRHDPHLRRGVDRPHSLSRQGRPLRRRARRLALQRRDRARAARRADVVRVAHFGRRQRRKPRRGAGRRTASISPWIARDARPTPLAFVMRGTAQTGSRYSFYLDATAFDGGWSAVPAPLARLAPGTCTSVRSPPSIRATARAWSRRCVWRTSAPPTSFDPNIRPLVTPDRGSVVALVERQVCSRPASSKRAKRICNGSIPTARSRTRSAHGRGAARAFAWRRSVDRGAVAFLGYWRLNGRGAEGRGRRHRRRRRQLHVLAARPRWIATARSARAPPAPSVDRLEAWLAFAATASAITCTRKGSDPPTAARKWPNMRSFEYSTSDVWLFEPWTKGEDGCPLRTRGEGAKKTRGELQSDWGTMASGEFDFGSSPPSRPLSPHLGIYRLTLTMIMSGTHRITGMGLPLGVLLLAWFLIAASMDASAFSYFSAFIQSFHRPARAVRLHLGPVPSHARRRSPFHLGRRLRLGRSRTRATGSGDG